MEPQLVTAVVKASVVFRVWQVLPAGGVGLFCVTQWTERCICFGLEVELLKIQGYVKVCVLPPGVGTL